MGHNKFKIKPTTKLIKNKQNIQNSENLADSISILCQNVTRQSYLTQATLDFTGPYAIFGRLCFEASKLGYLNQQTVKSCAILFPPRGRMDLIKMIFFCKNFKRSFSQLYQFNL